MIHTPLKQHIKGSESFLVPQLIPTALQSTVIVTNPSPLCPLPNCIVPSAVEQSHYLKIKSASLLHLHVSILTKQPDFRLNFHNKAESSYIFQNFNYMSPICSYIYLQPHRAGRGMIFGISQKHSFTFCWSINTGKALPSLLFLSFGLSYISKNKMICSFY